MAHTTVRKESRNPEKSMTAIFVLGWVRSAKRLILVLLLGAISNAGYATSYTTSAAGDLNNKANWTPNPANFTTQGDTWNIILPMSVATVWSVTGNVTISTGGSVNDMGNTIYFGGHFTNNVDSSAYIASGTAVFNSEFPQAIGGTAATTFNNLTRSNNGLSFNANSRVNGNFIGKGLIIDGGNTIYFGGNVAVTTGNNLFTGTAVFNGNGAQSVTGNPEFNSLIINKTSSLTFNSDETIKGDLALYGTLADGGNAVTVAANITGDGKETGTGGITITGSMATISGVAIDNLTLNNPIGFSLTGNTTVNSALTFKAGALIIGNNTLTLTGTVSGMDAKKCLTGSAASNLAVGAIGASGTIYFDQGTQGITNNIATLAMNGPGGTFALGNKLFVSVALCLTAGTIDDGGNAISVSGNITGTGTESGAGGILMNGASATISGVTVDKLTLNNATAFSLTGSATINALIFSAGTLTIGSNTLIISGTVSGMGPASYLTGSPSSNLTIANTGGTCTLYFDQATDGLTNNIAALAVNGARYSVVRLGNKLVSGTSVILSKGQLQLNDQTLELNGTFSGSVSDNIRGSASSNLTINTKTDTAPLYFDQDTKGGTNNIAKLIINAAGATVTLGSPLSISAQLALNGGTLADGGNAIDVAGNITGSGNETGAAGISMTGVTSAISGASLTNLTLNVSSDVGLAGNLVIHGALTFTNGKLNIGNNTLTLNGTVSGMSPKNCFTGGPNSNLTIGTEGTVGAIFFDQANKGVSNALSACNISNENSSVIFSSPLALGSPAHEKRHKRHRLAEPNP